MGWDPSIVNVNGGAIAIGHPIGASGCRVLNTLLFEMKRRDAKKGLATLCIGGGMGVALVWSATKRFDNQIELGAQWAPFFCYIEVLTLGCDDIAARKPRFKTKQYCAQPSLRVTALLRRLKLKES